MNQDDALIEKAIAMRTLAYAPYSHYRVGAALLDDTNKVQWGCNVENISFGVTLCAERVAIGRMVSDGGRWVRTIAVATQDGGSPCGICLQALLEFADQGTQMRVLVVDEARTVQEFTLNELMPRGFSSLEIRS